ncbi:MAG: hypothetical protein IKD46_00615, partial [Lentisphaeria bacterium]|nr:hypothetical protein [Lentisphaeria bacterium]
EAVDAAAENGVITLLKDGETAIVGKTITILREHEGTKYEATVSALKDYTVIEDEGQTRYEVKEAKALEDETDEPALAYIDLNKNGTYDPIPAAGTADGETQYRHHVFHG